MRATATAPAATRPISIGPSLTRVTVVLDDLVITRPGPRIVDGLEALAKAIHPELYP